MPKSKSTEFIAWANMKQRCFNYNHPQYSLYGGRGITICERWLGSFDAFLEDMGPKPAPELSIDRYPDKNGNYEPGNCRWATSKQQVSNRNPKHTFTPKKPKKEYVHNQYVNKQQGLPEQKSWMDKKFGLSWQNVAYDPDIDFFAAMGRVESKNKYIIWMRLAGYTLREIGDVTGKCREGIRQKEASLVKEIKRELCSTI